MNVRYSIAASLTSNDAHRCKSHKGDASLGAAMGTVAAGAESLDARRRSATSSNRQKQARASGWREGRIAMRNVLVAAVATV